MTLGNVALLLVGATGPVIVGSLVIRALLKALERTDLERERLAGRVADMERTKAKEPDARAWRDVAERVIGYRDEFTAILARADALIAARADTPGGSDRPFFGGLVMAKREIDETASIWDAYRRLSSEADAYARREVADVVCRDLLPPMDYGNAPPDLDALRPQIVARRDAFDALAGRLAPAVKS